MWSFVCTISNVCFKREKHQKVFDGLVIVCTEVFMVLADNLVTLLRVSDSGMRIGDEYQAHIPEYTPGKSWLYSLI